MLRKITIITIIMLVINSSFLVTGSEVEVTPGKTLYVGGSGPGNYSKIQDAIDNASDGDTVFVYDDSSPYYESLTINKSLYLIGENKNTTILHSVLHGPYISAIRVLETEGVTINNFTIQSNISGILTEEIHVYKCPYIVISNNILNSEADTGISVQFSNNIDINNNNIYNKKIKGIYIRESDNSIISSNIVADTYGDEFGWGYGLYLTGLHQSTISKNIIMNNSRCGLLLSGSNNRIYQNNIEDNHKFGIYVSSSSSNKILENNIVDNKEELFFSSAFFNKWDRNYWGQPLILKFIKGRFYTYQIVPVSHTIFKIDWHPAKVPYEIS